MVFDMSKVKKRAVAPNARREKAAATRRKILDAAQLLFSEYGYAGTTMQAIADQSDVAVQTVYFVFHTKRELLLQLLKTVGAPPDESIDTMERDWVKEAMTDPDGRRTIALMVEYGNDIYARVAPVWEAIGQGASVEPDVAEAWDEIVEQRRLGIIQIIESLDDRGQLKEGLAVDRAADIIFGLQRPETLTVFVTERGWSLVEYKEWSFNTLCFLLINTETVTRQVQSPRRGLTFVREHTSSLK